MFHYGNGCWAKTRKVFKLQCLLHELMTKKNFSPADFWKEYYEADFIKREKLLERIAKAFDNFFSEKIKDKKLRKRTMIMLLRSYFDDLIEYMEEIKRKKD